MKHNEAIEGAFTVVNTYYLLMWLPILIIGSTLFFENRAVQNERLRAIETIEFYEDIVPLADSVSIALNEVIIRNANIGTELQILSNMRFQYDQSRRIMREAHRNNAVRRDIDDNQREAIYNRINYLSALLYYNAPFNDVPGVMPLRNFPSLTLGDKELGTLGIADNINNLTIKDSVRFLWLSSIPMNAIVSQRDDILKGTHEGGDFDRALRIMQGLAREAANWKNRSRSQRLWAEWLSILQPVGDDTFDIVKRLTQEQLTLSQPKTRMVEAFDDLLSADQRFAGAKAKVELPGIGMKFQLSDALILLPWLTIVFAISIAVHSSRVVYLLSQRRFPDSDVIGFLPVFYAGYKSHFAVRVFFLSAPVIIIWFLPFLIPNDVLNTESLETIYMIGVILSIVLAFHSAIQVKEIDSNL